MKLGHRTLQKAILVDVDGYQEVFIESKCSFYEKLLGCSKSFVILSPSFYWIKKESIAISNARKARKFAPAIFNGILPPGNYDYKAVKTNQSQNELCFMAYDKESINDKLSKFHNIKLDLEKCRIYLAQTELMGLEGAVRISDKDVLLSMDGIVTKIPVAYANSSVTSWAEAASDIKPSLGYISLGSSMPDFKEIYGSINKKLLLLGAILLIGASAFIMDVFLNYRAISEIREQKNLLVEEMNIPPTKAEFDAAKAKMESTEKKQLAIRGMSKVVNSIPLIAGESVEKYVYEKDTVALTIRSQRGPELRKYFESNAKLLGFISNGDKIECRISK